MSFARTAPRILRSLPPSSSSSAAARLLPRVTPLPLAARQFSSTQKTRMVVSQIRYEAQARSAWAKEPIVKYEELKPITQQPTDDILVIDVREPDEVALGSIPSAVNLPLSRFKDALDRGTNPGDFQREFAFTKPTFDQKIIVFCRSGKRSANAASQASEKGYHNVRNYVGSWLDWSKREGENKDD
ncbi:hypothetical protein IAU59_004440 [Kwoniella sp. CBS 9459]